ncbi:MAG: hypothetical protein GY850_20765, partial [bacterium]|nr:hypothetical protein [bacterium]
MRILTAATNEQFTSATQKQKLSASKKSHLSPIVSEKSPQVLPLSNTAFCVRDFGAASATMSFYCICSWCWSPIVTGYPTTVTIHTVKAIAAYVIGARPQSEHRRGVFLTMPPPFRPISANGVGGHITKAMRKAGLSSTAYWLRHTYAQNLLEAGTSIFEIKEMLG